MHYVTENWSFDPFLVVVIVLVAAHEVGLARLRARSVAARTRQRRLRSLAFYGGLGVLLIAVESPIDYWASDYFFVHMIEHLLIAFYAPILIVAGAPWIPLLFALPVGVSRRLGRFLILGAWSSFFRAVGRVVLNPWFALISFNVVMVLWHVPALFDLAEQQPDGPHLAHARQLLRHRGAVLAPDHPVAPDAPEGDPDLAGGAIITTNIVMFVLAMALSIFTATSWYSVYAHIPGVTLPPFADQQIGAAILWVCGDFWAVPALIVIIKRAMDQEGGLADAVDRLFHRDPSVALGDLRQPGALGDVTQPG